MAIDTYCQVQCAVYAKCEAGLSHITQSERQGGPLNFYCLPFLILYNYADDVDNHAQSRCSLRRMLMIFFPYIANCLV